MAKRRAAVPLPFASLRGSGAPTAAPCIITFAHNVKDEKVGLLFSGPITAIELSPEQAEHVAKQLIHEAALARGDEPEPTG